MIKINPEERPTVDDVFAELVSLAADRNVDLKGPIIVSRRCIYTLYYITIMLD